MTEPGATPAVELDDATLDTLAAQAKADEAYHQEALKAARDLRRALESVRKVRAQRRAQP